LAVVIEVLQDTNVHKLSLVLYIREMLASWRRIEGSWSSEEFDVLGDLYTYSINTTHYFLFIYDAQTNKTQSKTCSVTVI